MCVRMIRCVCMVGLSIENWNLFFSVVSSRLFSGTMNRHNLTSCGLGVAGKTE